MIYFIIPYIRPEYLKIFLEIIQIKKTSYSLVLLSTLCMVETVGRALPCFRHGTDYILNL